MQTSLSNDRRVQILIGLSLAIGIASLPLGPWGERLRVLGPLLGHEVLWWLAVATLLLYVLRVERLPLSSIGLRRLGLWDIVLAILAGVVMVTATAMISAVFPRFHLQINVQQLNRWLAAPFWYRFILVIRAAVAEEILLRAYPFERLEELTSSRFLAAIISWIAFTIVHLRTWGWAYLMIVGFYGVILTLLYLWRRNLCSNILAHWILDAAVYLLP